MTEEGKGPQTNIGGDVHGPVLSGVFHAPVIVKNFINEKIFKRFGLEQRLGFALLAVTVIATGLGLYFALHPTQPKHMSGDFRIAVAGLSESGHTRKSELGMQLAEDVYLRLKENFTNIDLGFVVTVWGPNEVGMISGQNRQDRAAAAAQLAEKISADIVIYGSVDTSETWWEITPEFYVTARNFYQAEEIVGQYEIGHTFRVLGDRGLATRMEINNQLATRTDVLFRITMGLAYFQLHKYETALEVFTSAMTVAGVEDKGVKQVLYLWLGNTAGRTFDLDAAEIYHQHAIELDPDYARPYIGLAGVYYLRALQPFQESLKPTDIDATWLWSAIDMYQQALAAANKPLASDIETKVHYGFGQCYTMLAYSDNGSSYASAFAEFKIVIVDYNDGDNLRVRELAAESHAWLGLIYSFTADYDGAIDEYTTAISLLDEDPERQQIYRKRLEVICGNSLCD